jgi:hypothetical protein
LGWEIIAIGAIEQLAPVAVAIGYFESRVVSELDGDLRDGSVLRNKLA